MMDNQTLRVMLTNQVDQATAERIIDSRLARIDANFAQREAAREARQAEIEAAEGIEITPETQAKVAKVLARRFFCSSNTSKPRRAWLANLVGQKVWQQIANPQTRQLAVAALDEATGQMILDY